MKRRESLFVIYAFCLYPLFWEMRQVLCRIL